MHLPSLVAASLLGLACGLPALAAPQIPDPLPRPDGKPAEMSKPVQVYILMGQSNMLGFGKPDALVQSCKNGLYPYLVDEQGKWTTRKDVRYTRVMCSGNGPSKVHNNQWMTVHGRFGPEIGIGHYVGHVTRAPVLILKSCIGNRSLGYDLLPPTAPGYEGDPNPGSGPKSGGWYAGVQYDGDVAAAKKVLRNIGKYYPGARGYQVAGFFWWQGDKDFRNNEHAAAYEKNLLHLIKCLRRDFRAPKARFVCASLGQTRKGAGGNQGKILEAILNIDGKSGKYRDHKGLVASVYAHPLSKGGSSSGHYGGNPETYMNVGQAMGKAMAELILKTGPGIPGIDPDKLSGPLRGVYKDILAGKLGAADEVLRAYLSQVDSRPADQKDLAYTLNEHLGELILGATGAMDGFLESGDYCGLRDALAEYDKTHRGLPEYEKRRETWASSLGSDKAVRELAAGEQWAALLAKAEKLSLGEFFVKAAAFQRAHPGSFYARQAAEKLAGARAALRKTLDKIEALGKSGDVYAKLMALDAAREDFGKIPEFEAAEQRWDEEKKDPAIKEALAAGKEFSKIFESVARLNERLKAAQQKDKRIRGRIGRQKAQAKTKAAHERRLKSLANRLEKLAKKYPDNYYGKAAALSFDLYEKSQGAVLEDPRK